jgi:hypothetical protein
MRVRARLLALVSRGRGPSYRTWQPSTTSVNELKVSIASTG